MTVNPKVDQEAALKRLALRERGGDYRMNLWEAHQILGIPLSTVQKLVRKGDITHEVGGLKHVVTAGELARYIKEGPAPKVVQPEVAPAQEGVEQTEPDKVPEIEDDEEEENEDAA